MKSTTYIAKNQEKKGAKSFLFFACFLMSVLIGFSGGVQAKNFYLTAQGASNAQLPSSWNESQNGSGKAAKRFTDKGDVFIIPSGIHGQLNGNMVFGPVAANPGAAMELIVDGIFTLKPGYCLTLRQSHHGTATLLVRTGGLIRFLDRNAYQLVGDTNANGTKAHIRFVMDQGARIETNSAKGICGSVNASINNKSVTINMTNVSDFIFNTNGDTLEAKWLPPSIRSLKVTGTGKTRLYTDVEINGPLEVDSGSILDLMESDLTGSDLVPTGKGTIRTGSKSTTPLPSGKCWNIKVEYTAPDSQVVVEGDYTDLVFESGRKKINGPIRSTGKLELKNGARLELGNGKLHLSGTFSSSPSEKIVASRASELVIDGSGSLGSPIYVDASADTGFKSINVNRSGSQVTLGNKVKIYGTVEATAGTIVSNGNLVLASDANGTAQIAAGAGTIEGKVVVQRHIPATARRWRFMASQVANATLADWKNEIHITGTGGANNGFDASGSNAASVYTYDETMITGDMNTGWKAATNINNPLVPGRGYRLFVRGSRQPGRLAGTLTSQDEVVLDLQGEVNSGDIDMHPTFTSSGKPENDGWNFLGNPYASPIDWNKFYDDAADYTNLSPIVYVYNAVSNSYVSYNALSNSGTLTNGIIPSGAAFYVKATGTPTMVMKEKYKVSALPRAMFKSQYENRDFRIRMTMDSINQDEMVVKYLEQATPSKDEYDINKMWGAEVNIAAIGKDLSYLAMQAKPFAGEGDTVKLAVYARVTGTYSMSFVNAEEYAQGLPLYLLDYYTGNIIDLRNDSAYSFTINMSDAQSYGDNRFELVLGKMPVEIKTRVQEAVNEISGLTLYPYATDGNIHIKGISSSENFIEVRDIQGNLVAEFDNVPVSEKQINLDLSSLSPALYFVWIEQGPGSKPVALKCVKTE